MTMPIRLIFLAAMFCCLNSSSASPVSTATAQPQPEPIELKVHIKPPAANDSRYFYVPFNVPNNAARIDVTYQYDRAKETNTLDIGLFDARSSGRDTDPAGFRGWSGGRRAEFFISQGEATPGYMPGALPAGTWRIILGLYRVAPGGVDVTFKITIEIGTSKSPAPVHQPGTRPSASQKIGKSAGEISRWWSGDMHMHTVHSDGNWTIAELISSASARGLDFICITDHNTASHHREIDHLNTAPPPLVMRGEEITTYGGHTNAWGLPSGTWIDFRAHPGDSARIKAIAAETHRAGALISINHPSALCSGCNWSYENSAASFDGIEVWNGSWEETDEQALLMWDKLLQAGRRITAIGSSDSHKETNPIGQPTTHAFANALSQTALLAAIKRGSVYLSSEPAGPTITFTAQTTEGQGQHGIGMEVHLTTPGIVRFMIGSDAASADATVSFISNGKVLQKFPASAAAQAIEIECRESGYFRVEVRDKTHSMLALTNPIYVRVEKNN